ncbi:MAG: hypothetical protein AAF902_06775 [Chloroflexota bacterium]
MNADNPNRRNILIGLAILIAVLVIGLIYLGIYFFQVYTRADSEIDGGVAVLPTQTPTATPFPTQTPTPTNTPLPTNTPTPTPSPTPRPMTFKITGPKFVSSGLPQKVSWTVEATGGDGAATVLIDSLGGAMLTGDEGGNVIIARTLSSEFSNDALVGYDQEFVISAILDPNINSGVLSMEIRNQTFAEPILVPWIAITDEGESYQSFDIMLDGVEDQVQAVDIPQPNQPDPIVTSGDSTTAAEPVDFGELPEPLNRGYFVFRSRDGVELEYPETWFITEAQDGLIDLSLDPLGDGLAPLPGEAVYASIFAGTADDYGLDASQGLNPLAVKELILGASIPSGSGDDQVLLTESGLEITTEFEMTLPEGYSGNITFLRTPADFTESGEVPFESIFAVITTDDRVIVLNGYTPSDQFEQLSIMETIANTLRFADPVDAESTEPDQTDSIEETGTDSETSEEDSEG